MAHEATAVAGLVPVGEAPLAREGLLDCRVRPPFDRAPGGPDAGPARAPRAARRRPREPFNALSHLAGAVAAVIAGIGLTVASRGHPWGTASFIVFGLSSLLLFTASAALHGVRAGPAVIERLRRADHAAIFVLIAGSYTPVTLVTLRAARPAWGWTLFAVVWALATLGIVFKMAWFRAPRWLSTGLYLGLGWMAIVAIGPIARSMAAGGVALLVGGGMLYSLGAVIYARRRPDPWPRSVGFHGLWHLFVLAGWGAHLAMMALYVVPS